MAVRNVFRLLVFVLSLVGGLALLVFLIIRQGPDVIFESIAGFGLMSFLGFILISLLNFVFYSLRWQLIINHHLPKGQGVSLFKMYKHRMGGFAVSYLTPAAQVGGEPVRMALLGTEKNVSLKQSTSSVVLDIAFELSAYVLFIVAGVGLALAQGLGDVNSLMAILLALLIFLVFLLAFFTAIAKGNGFFGPIFRLLKLDKMKKMKRVGGAILDTENIMKDFLHKNPKLVFIVAFLSVLVISFRIIEVFYISYFFGVDLNFAQAFLVSTLPGIALLLPVPAGVGVFEGSFAAVFGLLAIPLNAVAFALVIRSRDLVFIIIGSIHIMAKGSSFLKKKILQPLLKGG